MRRQLIVNADDFARDPEVSRGILVAHQQGIVTTTTALINLPGAIQAVQDAAQLTPSLGIGLHLNLTLGTPCSPISDIRKLVNEADHFHKVDYWHKNPQSVPINMVEIEWRAQIDKFNSTGLIMDHLDSHHHIAVIRPDIWELYLELAREFNCGVRPPYPNDVSSDDLGKIFPPHLIEYARTNAIQALKRSSVPHPDSFLGSFFDEHANQEHLQKLLEQLSTGTTELMCHPGYTSEALEATSSYARRRPFELEALVDPRTKEIIEDLEIDLVTFKQVWPSF
jgi:predicted glycoside hydrolase/deacetylase ChbG (UPF0249 family)